MVCCGCFVSGFGLDFCALRVDLVLCYCGGLLCCLMLYCGSLPVVYLFCGLGVVFVVVSPRLFCGWF